MQRSTCLRALLIQVVVKLTHEVIANEQFESLVNSSSGKTKVLQVNMYGQFESLVNSSSGKTTCATITMPKKFESLVNSSSGKTMSHFQIKNFLFESLVDSKKITDKKNM